MKVTSEQANKIADYVNNRNRLVAMRQDIERRNGHASYKIQSTEEGTTTPVFDITKKEVHAILHARIVEIDSCLAVFGVYIEDPIITMDVAGTETVHGIRKES